MPSYLYDIGEQGRAVSRFIAHVRSELQKAYAQERTERKLTQQKIATTLGVNRSVINRQLMGLENMTVRSVAELAWAIGWTPNFSVSKYEQEGNYFITADVTPKPPTKKRIATRTNTSNSEVEVLEAV